MNLCSFTDKLLDIYRIHIILLNKSHARTVKMNPLENAENEMNMNAIIKGFMRAKPSQNMVLWESHLHSKEYLISQVTCIRHEENDDL